MITAIRTTSAGYRDGKVLMQFRANWYCTKAIDADWDLRDVGWRIRIDGDAPLDISIENRVPRELLAEVAAQQDPVPGLSTRSLPSVTTPMVSSDEHAACTVDQEWGGNEAGLRSAMLYH